MDDIYICPRCNHDSCNKANLKIHLKRKKICDPILCNISREKCFELLNLKKTEYTIEIQKIIYKSLVKNSEELLKYKKENEDLKNELSIVRKSVSGIVGDYNTNNVINSNNDITNNINITVNNYADTDYSMLMQKENVDKCVKSNGEFDFSKFISLLHFNPKFPQNHNLILTDKKEKIVSIYNNGIFEQYTKGFPGLKKILQEKLEHIENNPDEFDTEIAEASYTLKDDYFKFDNYNDEEKKDILYNDVYQPLLNGTERIKTSIKKEKPVKKISKRATKKLTSK